jgi:outer membrane protein assembly factor BamB
MTMTTSVGRTTAAAVALLLLPSLRAAAAAAAPGTLVWSTQLSCNASIPTTIVWSSPVVDPHRGAVFIGSRDTDLYRLDARDGRIVYNVSVGGYIDSSPTLSALIGETRRRSP